MIGACGNKCRDISFVFSLLSHLWREGMSPSRTKPCFCLIRATTGGRTEQIVPFLSRCVVQQEKTQKQETRNEGENAGGNEGLRERERGRESKDA